MRELIEEYCPFCESEFGVFWDVEEDGYRVYCPYCGKPNALCSMCDARDGAPCDWQEGKGCKHVIPDTPQDGASHGHDPYKVDQLTKMLRYETREGEAHYGARLSHQESGAKMLTIDAGGLQALITHYATHKTDLGNC